MDPLLISVLSVALLSVAGKLDEKAMLGPALESSVQPFKDWLTRDYKRAKAEKSLEKTFVFAPSALVTLSEVAGRPA